MNPDPLHLSPHESAISSPIAAFRASGSDAKGSHQKTQGFFLEQEKEKRIHQQGDQSCDHSSSSEVSQQSNVYQLIFHQLKEGLFILNQHHQIVDANPTFQALLGYSLQELRSHTWEHLIAQPYINGTWHLQQAFEQGIHRVQRLPFRTRDGKCLEVNLALQKIDGNGQDFLCGTVTDAVDLSSHVVPISHTSLKLVDLEEKSARERECLIGAISQRIRHGSDLETLLETAVRELGDLLAVDHLAIMQALPSPSGWRTAAEFCQHPSQLPAIHWPLSIKDRSITQRLQTGQVVQVALSEAGEHQDDDDLSPPRPNPGLLVPLISQKFLWGCLYLVGQDGDDAIAVDQLQVVAEQLMLAIEQSINYQQIQQLNVSLEYTVKQRTERLQQALSCEAMLKRITDKVRDSLDENHILETVVEELALLFGAECCDTALYDLKQGTCTVVHEYTTCFPSAKGKTIPMASSHCEIYDRLRQGQHVQIGAYRLETRPEITQRTILACPILDNHGVLGDIWLFRPWHENFDDLEERLVQQVANQCAIAIRQARLYQASQAQIETLEHINTLKDNFLSTISHELRTPIATIKMAIQMLTLALGREGLLPDPNKPVLNSGKIPHYLKILNDECNREIGLITDLLDLQKLEAGASDAVHPQTIVLEPYLQRIVRPFQEQQQNQQQTFELAIAPDLPSIESDPQCLERILVELLTNAYKYTPTGETITVEASRAPTDSDAAIWLAIKNSGVEIPSDQLGSIFDKFYRIPNQDPHRHGGIGLGLALVKKLTFQIGGRVWAESNHGQTCFKVEIPICATY